MARFHGPDEPVYTIQVASRLTNVSAPMLRYLERMGLVQPTRTEGNIRLYSENDLELISRISYLIREAKVNAAGVKVILQMEVGHAIVIADEDEEKESQEG
ncbi:MAG TPA: MerR family transcriptional regulator [Bacillota bacterium]|nr:MerR family transcriptional regulator [Bacillota bacterium]